MVLVCTNYSRVPKHQEAKEPNTAISYHANLMAKNVMLYLTKKNRIKMIISLCKYKCHVNFVCRVWSQFIIIINDLTHCQKALLFIICDLKMQRFALAQRHWSGLLSCQSTTQQHYLLTQNTIVTNEFFTGRNYSHILEKYVLLMFYKECSSALMPKIACTKNVFLCEYFNMH